MKRDENIETLNANELAQILLTYGKAKVYLSSDSEGNSFATLCKKQEQNWSIGFQHKDNVLILYPFQEGLDIADIAPQGHAEFMEQMSKEGLNKNNERKK